MPQVTLFNADNGLSCVVDAGGKGLRGKSWLDELSRWAKEGVEPAALAGIGLGRLANFPTIIDGRKNEVRALGEALVDPAYNGIELFECVPNTLTIGIGSAAVSNFNNAALTQGDPALANYATAGAASGTVGTPVNCLAYPAFITTDVENWNLSGAALVAGGSVLTITVNGAAYAIPVGAGAATTTEQLAAFINAANVPVRCVSIATGAGATDQLRIMTLNAGRAATISADTGADDCGSVIFATETNAVRYGYGAILNDARMATAANMGVNSWAGIKPQRRILPGSITLSTTLAAAAADSMTDDRGGVLSNLAGTSVGTVNYTTGLVTHNWAANVAAATDVVARFRALWPVNLHEEVSLPESGATQMAIRLL
jgi:hypothetical protein